MTSKALNQFVTETIDHVTEKECGQILTNVGFELINDWAPIDFGNHEFWQSYFNGKYWVRVYFKAMWEEWTEDLPFVPVKSYKVELHRR